MGEGDVAIGFEEIHIGKKIYTGEYLILILTPKFLTHVITSFSSNLSWHLVTNCLSLLNVVAIWAAPWRSGAPWL